MGCDVWTTLEQKTLESNKSDHEMRWKVVSHKLATCAASTLRHKMYPDISAFWHFLCECTLQPQPGGWCQQCDVALATGYAEKLQDAQGHWSGFHSNRIDTESRSRGCTVVEHVCKSSPACISSNAQGEYGLC